MIKVWVDDGNLENVLMEADDSKDYQGPFSKGFFFNPFWNIPIDFSGCSQIDERSCNHQEARVGKGNTQW